MIAVFAAATDAPLVAVETAEDIVKPALFGLIGPLRVGKQLATHAYEVSPALRDDLLGKEWVSDLANGDNWYFDYLFDGSSQVTDAAGGREERYPLPVGAMSGTARYVKGINSCLFEQWGLPNSILNRQAAFNEIGPVYSHDMREIRPTSFLTRLINSQAHLALFSGLPPYSSVLKLVDCEKKELIR